MDQSGNLYAWNMVKYEQFEEKKTLERRIQIRKSIRLYPKLIWKIL